MTFHDVRLPLFIECYACGGPGFSNNIVTTVSGREIRNAEYYQSRQKYFIQNCRLSKEQFAIFNQFFRSRMGRLHSFRFRDVIDYQVKRQPLTLTTNKLELYKSYEDPILPYMRRITKPVEGTIKLYSSSQEFLPNKINYTLGIVEISGDLLQYNNLFIDYIFDVEVRFNSDHLTYHHSDDGAIELQNLELIEITS